jgi:hypothetical protein
VSRKNRKGVPKGKPSQKGDQTTYQAASQASVIKPYMPPADGNQGDRQKKRHDAFEVTGLVIQTITLIVLGIYTGINYLLYKNSVDSFQATQRAYVSLGDETSKLAEFRDREGLKKPIVILHFFNSGDTVARHFRATIYSSSIPPSSNFPTIEMPQGHRHRFRVPPSDDFPEGVIVETQGTLVTDVRGTGRTLAVFQSEFGWIANQPKGPPTETADIAPKGRKLEYLTDDKWLLPRAQLNDPSTDFTVVGWAEYCDVLGKYHCKGLTARYLPAPINDFVESNDLQCVVETVGPQNVHLPKGSVEIAPCEQPNEPEYVEVKTP